MGWGALVFGGQKNDRQRNEMHDCFLYATAAGLRHGVNFVSDQGWARLRAELEAPAPLPEAGRVRRSISELLAS
jgi:phage terminase large subunit GpA-like protein